MIFSSPLLILAVGPISTYKCFTLPAKRSFICKVELPVVTRFAASALAVDETMSRNCPLFRASNTFQATFKLEPLVANQRTTQSHGSSAILMEKSATPAISFGYFIRGVLGDLLGSAAGSMRVTHLNPAAGI